MFDPSPTLIFPELRSIYAALAPIVETAMRVAVGVCLVPHGLRMGYGFFPNTGLPIRSWRMLGDSLNRWGYRPGYLWAVVIVATELIGGPMLVLGLFTRAVSVPIVILLALSIWEHGTKDGWFWNKLGMEYPLIWTLAAAYFLINGGGMYSLDRLIGWEF